jgi:hypothetical protein
MLDVKFVRGGKNPRVVEFIVTIDERFQVLNPKITGVPFSIVDAPDSELPTLFNRAPKTIGALLALLVPSE